MMRVTCITKLLVVILVAVRGKDLTDDACAAGHSKTMCEEYSYPIAGIWQQDADCCACQGKGRCAPGSGYVLAEAIMEGTCYVPAAHGDCHVRTTCCVPASSQNDKREYVRAPMKASSWNKASEYCNDNHGGLAIIDSPEENFRAKSACGTNGARPPSRCTL